MAHAVPFAKLAGLLVKTLAKPVSKRIKRDFSRSQPTRRVLISIGQTSHSVTSRMTIWSEGYKVRSITPLEEDQALNVGSEFVGEAFILLVSSGTVVWEYSRSKEKERVKDEERRAQAKAEREALQANFLALDARLKALEEVVEYNTSSILNIAGKRYKEPEKKDLVLVPITNTENAAQDSNINNNNKNEKGNNEHHAVKIQQPDPHADESEFLPPNEIKPWWKFW